MGTGKPSSIEELWVTLRKRLAESDYLCTYATEMAFEGDVWARVVDVVTEMGLNTKLACLTSHAVHPGRSLSAWKNFCSQELGPDVNVLGTNNRLDIVVRHPEYGSIGIEVKCLGTTGHAGKLTQGVGQAVLALAHRDRTLLIIHCGTMSIAERKRLREISTKMCNGMRTAVVVVPHETRSLSKERRSQDLSENSLSRRERRSTRTEWRWQEGAVDPDGEHIEVRYGDASNTRYEEWIPIALIGKPRRRVFRVRWLRMLPAIDTAIIGEVHRELDFYLVDKREPNPWAYAIYHCSTGANMYSKVHWSYFPSGRQGERQSSMVIQRSGKSGSKIRQSETARRERGRLGYLKRRPNNNVKGFDYTCVFLLTLDWLAPGHWTEEQIRRLA